MENRIETLLNSTVSSEHFTTDPSQYRKITYIDLNNLFNIEIGYRF